jgi:catechol 2,3-dioxygenase-like lactoylglutathione lyase family enzyme
LFYIIIDHIIITVSDLKASKALYQKALAPLGYKATPEYIDTAFPSSLNTIAD